MLSKLGDVEEEMNEIDEILAMVVASMRTLRNRTNPKSKTQNPK